MSWWMILALTFWFNWGPCAPIRWWHDLHRIPHVERLHRPIPRPIEL